MNKLILFGDSNTYGYDPRGFLGGRYLEDIRWTTQVKNAFFDKYEVIEEGQNGRMLPDVGYGYFSNLIQSTNEGDIFVMMLGTNDILLTNHPNVKATLAKLELILAFVSNNCLGTFILIAPPYIKIMDEQMKMYHDCCVKLNAGYLSLAKKYKIKAIDASTWNIAMGFDGVHFSIDGHKQFAKCFVDNLF